MPKRTAVKRVVERLRQVADDQLGDALGGAHHRGGLHGLVGGDEHEALDAQRVGQLGHVAGAEDVVLDRLLGRVSMSGTCLWAAAWKTNSGR